MMLSLLTKILIIPAMALATVALGDFPGDLTNNGNTNAEDQMILNDILLGRVNSSTPADINSDGMIDAGDAQLMAELQRTDVAIVHAKISDVEVDPVGNQSLRISIGIVRNETGFIPSQAAIQISFDGSDVKGIYSFQQASVELGDQVSGPIFDSTRSDELDKRMRISTFSNLNHNEPTAFIFDFFVRKTEDVTLPIRMIVEDDAISSAPLLSKTFTNIPHIFINSIFFEE